MSAESVELSPFLTLGLGAGAGTIAGRTLAAAMLPPLLRTLDLSRAAMFLNGTWSVVGAVKARVAAADEAAT